MTTSIIYSVLASHPIQTLLAVVVLYHAGAEFLGRRHAGRNRAPKGAAGTVYRSAA